MGSLAGPSLKSLCDLLVWFLDMAEVPPSVSVCWIVASILLGFSPAVLFASENHKRDHLR